MMGCYTFNEYFDWRSGVDLAVEDRDITPFSGGSRVLPEGLLNPSSLFKLGVVSWLVALAIGVYLTLLRGWTILALAFSEVLTGAFYTAPPFKWAYRGLGEPCKSCPLVESCGGCRSRAYSLTGDILAPDPLCPFIAQTHSSVSEYIP